MTRYPHLRQTEPEAGVWITESEICACITRIAFASADALIALAMLSLGGHRPAVLGRT
ncbi:MAG: hypothetical protein HQ453_12475 [Actinobacteria bacterium]|nr:hypothetical protein [Actinomycetota bacterium]